MYELSIIRRNRPFMRYPLKVSQIKIGSSCSNDLVFTDDGVAKFLCIIEEREGGFYLIDKSGNGTVINNKKFHEKQLAEGDRIDVGSVAIIFNRAKEDSSTQQQFDKPLRRVTSVLSYNQQAEEIISEEVQLRDAEGKITLIEDSTFNIGTDEGNQLVLRDPYVSRYHCRIYRKEDKYFIQDLNSTNGTWVNDVRVSAAEICHGSKIKVGTTRFVFECRSHNEKISPWSHWEFHGMVSKDNKMRKLFSLVWHIASYDIPVLIQGETGTGKEMLARTLHKLSPREKRPFIAVNCAAISKELVESELFGHERGAFTDAYYSSNGAFKEANGGTIFLDEIGDLPLNMQAKILRTLETGEVKKIGKAKPDYVNVRVIAATNRDLRQMMLNGEFRKDLFYRLYVVPITIPPLRERVQDIELLTNYFISQFSQLNSKIRIAPASVEKLKMHDWPGNVRELKNTIARAIICRSGKSITPHDITFPLEGLTDRVRSKIIETKGKSLEEIEKEIIIGELKRYKWNKKRVCESLGIARSTLHNKMKQYKIEKPKK
jgi:transcriptional regulator with PAS, ATPase and Fis domain